MKRAGFTLIELLVVIAIIAIMIALLIPAVQKVRESANRSKCMSNMRQICLAVHSFESVNKYLPPGNVTATASTGLAAFPNGSRSCHTFLLPYLEQQAIADMFNFGKAGDASPTHWSNVANRPAYQNRILIFECPSAPNPRVQNGPGVNVATTDYHVINGVVTGGSSANGSTGTRAKLVNFTYTELTRQGMLMTPSNIGGKLYLRSRLREVTDGTSNTIMFAERAGAPTIWKAGVESGVANNGDGGWAQEGANFNIAGSEVNGTPGGGPCAMNCTNQNEVYSFHNAGAFLGFGDGSVRFVERSIQIQYIYALVTRAAGDTIPEQPF